MMKFRKAIVAVASAAMVLGTMGVGATSAASSTSTCVSRAQFIYDFDVAAGITPVYPATSDFSDVASSSPYYGYIEAAFKAGYINGTGNGQFSPSGCLTRAQIAKIEVLALGDGSAAASDATSATTFTDDSAIPSWARGYVVEAVSLGLVHGYPDGSFSPNASMTATDEGYFLSQFKTTEAAGTLTVTASANDVAAGQQVTLTATGTNEPVTFSTTTGAVISGTTFIGSTPGTYTVTGQTASGLKGTATIAVYGAAVGVKVNAPTGVVANNMSQYTLTVDVIDANGNTVGNSTDSISLFGANTGIAGIDDGTGTATPAQTFAAVNGVATFTIDAGTVAGATETLTASDIANSATATGSITTVTQTATSLSVTAPTYVEANAANTGTASVTVLDQTGNPMLSGAYAVSVSLTGPAAFTADSTTGPESGAFVGPATTADFPFTSIQSETGAISFTASATGLTAGTATTTAVIAGAPAAIQLSADASTGNSFADGSGNAQFDAQIVDSHGYPVATADTLTFSLTDSQGNDAHATDGLLAAPGTDNTATNGTENVVITDPSSNANAGAYTVSVSDSLGLTAPAAQAFKITAGAADQVAITPIGDGSDINVAAASPTVTFTAQVEDAHGNAVAVSGLPVSFYGGYDITGQPYTFGTAASDGSGNSEFDTVTGANGSATATFTAEPYTNYDYWVYAQDTAGNLGSSNDIYVYVESTVASSLSVATTNGSNPQSVFTANDPITVNATATDKYGTPVSGDWVNITYGGVTNEVPTNGSGVATTTFTATTAGTATVTAQDLTAVSQPQASAVVAVNAGSQAGWAFFDASGHLVGNGAVTTGATLGGVTDTGTVTEAANTPIELWIKPIDAYGNAIVEAGNTTVTLTAPGAGAFRATANGSDISAPVAFNAGVAQLPIWFVSSAGVTNQSFNGAAK